MAKLFKTDPVAIRVDGSLTKGMGHIIRMLAVARELYADNIPVFFVMKPFEEGYSIIQKAGFPIFLIDKDYELHYNGMDMMKRIIANTDAKILIQDIKDTTLHYMLKLKRLGLFLINFDDTGTGATMADILIDPFISEEKTSPEIKRYFGPKYLILRDKFAHNHTKKVNEKIKKICIMPGGTDVGHMKDKVITWLSESQKSYELFVMAGASADANEEALYSNTENSVSVIRDWDAAADILSGCDLSIVSGGVSMCESCALGVPTLAIAQVEHELDNILTLEKNQAVVSAGSIHSLSKESFLEIFHGVENSPDFRQMLSDNGKKVVDGLGKKRVTRIIRDFYKDVQSSHKSMLLKVAVN